METKELLGEELYAQLTEALKGKGRDGKDLEFVLTNTGDYVPANKYDTLKEKYNKVNTDYTTLSSKYDADIASARLESENTLKKVLISNKLESAGVAKVNGNYDVYLNGGVIKLDEVKVENGNLIGADETITTFVTNNPNLVVKKEEPKKEEAVPAAAGLNPSKPTENIKDLAYYKEQYKNATDLTAKMAIKRQASEDGITI